MKMPEEKLDQLIEIAEVKLQTQGTISSAVDEIVKIVEERGFVADRKEIGDKLIEKMADEVMKELKRTVK